MFKAVLFDMDGVLNLYPDMFSRVYAKKMNIDPKPIEEFFKAHWDEVLTGKIDLKELLEEHREDWHIVGNVRELLDDWFKTEDRPNKELLKLVRTLRNNGIKCYLATNNEKYRVEYIMQNTFKNELDDVFSSAGLGVKKPDAKFFKLVLGKIKVNPNEVVYFDDSPEHIEAAKRLGVSAHIYKNPKQVEQLTLVE